MREPGAIAANSECQQQQESIQVEQAESRSSVSNFCPDTLLFVRTLIGISTEDWPAAIIVLPDNAPKSTPETAVEAESTW